MPRNSIVSTVFRPTRPAPGTTGRGLFGVIGGTAFAPGDGLTAVVTVRGRLVTARECRERCPRGEVLSRAGPGRLDAEAPPRSRGALVADLGPPHAHVPRRGAPRDSAVQPVRAASDHDDRACAERDAPCLCAAEPTRRAALHGALHRQRTDRPEESEPDPLTGLGRVDADQHDRAEPGRRRELERKAGLAARSHSGGRHVQALHGVPGQPDERGEPRPGRHARGRQHRARDVAPKGLRVPVMDIAIRGVAVYCFLYLLTRVIGRRELSSLEPFDLILLIILGDAVQQGLTQDDYSVTGAMIGVGAIAAMQVSTSFLSFRFRRLRPLLEGEPIIIVEDGKPIEQNLKRERLTAEELMAEARGQQIESLDNIKWAVLETSGKISFIEK
ncbi:MAG: DUF421 domain-containing protein [Actinobacteria bacterium]|nr:MAG: DUF421 domain-containing protein [Actinomycetota bacterium]